ncbi:hypothetical protein [Sphingomonas sp. TREG-RG-20F-R18-01]|uniref:hypothetical protein n=1 Tax=Sphingomonas sp. TREG-RG-20F-R18-01 TaxID=2914982 RepID=UPI001F588C77|nr:hypothetical protein [Sphingomonas sp. TREG-RG-20F-R18-01]
MGARVLIVGLDPDLVDYTDPDLPPGMDAARVHAGLVEVNAAFAARGDHVDTCVRARGL